jgi:hypothetical protein
MHADGIPFTEIHRRLGVSRNTVSCWLYRRRGADADPVERCPLCSRPPRPIDHPAAYAYLLGQYLGDGHLLTTQRVPLLTVMCDIRYPGVLHEVGKAMESTGARSAGFQERVGCIGVRSHWMHWPCLIPQHGPGKKHERAIALTEWQKIIVDQHAGTFARGLFHSDGSRFVNRVLRGGKAYSYPRYMFVNESADIMTLCRLALDRLGISWRMARPNSLSVARREAVAELDRHVGPKW